MVRFTSFLHFLCSFIFILFFSDNLQTTNQIFYPPRLTHGLKFEREARGVDDHTDEPVPTLELINHLKNIERREEVRLRWMEDGKFCSSFLQVLRSDQEFFYIARKNIGKPKKEREIMSWMQKIEGESIFNANLDSFARCHDFLEWFPRCHEITRRLSAHVHF